VKQAVVMRGTYNVEKIEGEEIGSACWEKFCWKVEDKNKF
jgi:hypothetical protein